MWIVFQNLTPWTSAHMLVATHPLKYHNNYVAIAAIINHNEPPTNSV